MSDALFSDTFGNSPKVSLFIPGRVNLIGEHTDYNGGWVLPTALEQGVSLSLSPRTDDKIRIVSDGFDGMGERTLNDHVQNLWSDYVTGAVIHAHREGLISGGADVALTTTLPHGAGLSSSAAVTVGILKLARTLADSALTDTEISVLARRVENEFIGMPCGIMDQMAVAIARPGQALALDTHDLSFSLVDLPKAHALVVLHSGVRRQLDEGRYAERKEECDAVKAILKRDDICLAELSDLQALTGIPLKRARHCVTEHRRTVAAADALRAHDMVTLGRLMLESHHSMRDDFEITVSGTDKIVEDGMAAGALGVRQTGGGFGGCIVALVENNIVEDWVAHILASHPAAWRVA